MSYLPRPVPQQTSAEMRQFLEQELVDIARLLNDTEAAATGVSELSDLTDVNTSTPTNRNVLVADGTDWESRALVEADISDLGSYAAASHTHVEADITDLGAYLENLVEDTTPQLGGNLDPNGYNITGTGKLSLTATGSHLTMYDSDGSDTLDRGLLELNANNINIYAYDNSATAWRLPFRCAVGDGSVNLAVSNCATVNITPTSNINLTPGSNVQVLSGAGLRVYEAANSDYGELTHDGTNFDISTGSADPIRIQPQNGENAVYCYPNGAVFLYYNNNRQIGTQSHTATANTSGGFVKAHSGSEHDIGFNVLPVFNSNVSDTLEAQHCGTIQFKGTTTGRTLTLEASTSTDFPVQGVTTVMNAYTSTNYTITEGSGTTLYYLDGSTRTDTAGGCTIGPGGVATIFRYSATIYYIWGSGITP